MNRIIFLSLLFLFSVTFSFSQESPINYDFAKSSTAENEITVMGPGFGSMPLAEVAYGSIPTDNAFDRATDGFGIQIVADPGEGVMFLTASLPITTCALVRASVRASGPQVSVYLATIDQGEHQFVSTITPNNGAFFAGRYNRLANILLPSSSGFQAVLQIVNTSTSEPLTVYVDNLEILPSATNRLDFALEDFVAGEIQPTPTPILPTPTLTPVGTPTSTVTPVGENINTLENFPDPNFRLAVERALNVAAGVPFTAIQAAGFKGSLECAASGITNAKGIEYLENISILNCSYNQLSSLNVSRNPALMELNCDFNRLSSLDVSRNLALERLYCQTNQLSSLDVSFNPVLETLRCNSNQLSNLDVSRNSVLVELNCDFNRLSSLDVSRNPALEWLQCSPSTPSLGLSGLDVSHNPALKVLFCGGNPLSRLDISNNPALEWLICSSNQLSSLDVSQNPALEKLDCSWNPLSSLDVSRNSALVELTCDVIQLSSLDVSQNSALEKLHCTNNRLNTLDISHSPALVLLNCSKNQLNTLDVSQNPSLEILSCDSNQLSSLDVSRNLALEVLTCSSNKLSSLDISNNPSLLMLSCKDNQLSSLDVSHNPALVELICDPTVTLVDWPRN